MNGFGHFLLMKLYINVYTLFYFEESYHENKPKINKQSSVFDGLNVFVSLVV